jgi:endonuclease YncB( thermonuclease family)
MLDRYFRLAIRSDSGFEELKDQTIHIRLAGVDAPEVRTLCTFLNPKHNIQPTRGRISVNRVNHTQRRP